MQFMTSLTSYKIGYQFHEEFLFVCLFVFNHTRDMYNDF